VPPVGQLFGFGTGSKLTKSALSDVASLFRKLFALNLELARSGSFKLTKDELSARWMEREEPVRPSVSNNEERTHTSLPGESGIEKLPRPVNSDDVGSDDVERNAPDSGGFMGRAEIVEQATRSGLISPSRSGRDYVFPLARLLSEMPEPVWRAVSSAFEVLLRKKIWGPFPAEAVEALIRRGFSHFEDKFGGVITTAVSLSEGLNDGNCRSVPQIAKLLGVSPKRIRRVQALFWGSLLEEHRDLAGSKKARNSKRKGRSKSSGKAGKGKILRLQKARAARRWFLAAFLGSFMKRSDSLVIDAGLDAPRDVARLKFLAKCVGIPCHEFPKIGVSLLGPKGYLDGCWDFPGGDRLSLDSIDFEVIAEWLERQEEGLTPHDLEHLSHAIRFYRLGLLNRTERAVLAMKSLNRPAHYSEIARAYGKMFEGDRLDDKSVHSLLLKDSSRHKDGYVVWAGARGVFVLREWGYERPTDTLYNQAEEIVRQKYAETGRPVSLTVIASELTAYRAVVKRSSLLSVLNSNPNISCVAREFFVPASEESKKSRPKMPPTLEKKPLLSEDVAKGPKAEDHDTGRTHTPVYFDGSLDRLLRDFERDRRLKKDAHGRDHYDIPGSNTERDGRLNDDFCSDAHCETTRSNADRDERPKQC